MRLHRRRFIALSAAAALCPWRGVAGGLPVTGGPAFGTYWRLAGGDPAREEAIRARLEDVVGRVDRAMSPYRPDSELSRINRNRQAGWIGLSDGLATVLRDAAAAHELTEGGFDPTVGPIVARYGFGPIRGESGGGFGALGLLPDALRKDAPGVTLDLNGIAKGYALDLMVAELDALGLGSFLLEIGGELFARGRHPEGRRWRVMVEPARTDGADPTTMPLEDAAIATSADTAQGFGLGGHAYGHVIDPARAAPVQGTASVSVIAATAMEADALATGLMALGPLRGPSLAARRGLAAHFQIAGADAVRRWSTDSFRTQEAS